MVLAVSTNAFKTVVTGTVGLSSIVRSTVQMFPSLQPDAVQSDDHRVGHVCGTVVWHLALRPNWRATAEEILPGLVKIRDLTHG